VFKYLGFFALLSNQVLGLAGLAASIPVLRFALPLGISFWTFQTVAYVVDVYKRKTPAERNPFYYLLAVMFFPVVTAGPITRVQTLVTQLKTKHRFDYDKMRSGLLLIGRGFFKKLMIADRLVVFVNTVFDNPRAYTVRSNSMLLLVAAVFFAVQLYCDFSGYTDIVRGSARLFGVELPINFRAPYFARSVKDFWRRWHITLMDWFREYIYFPLGGSRVGAARRYANLLAVFAISGLWHGAGLTYLVWGLLNGLYQVAGQLLAPLNDRVVRLLRVDRATIGHRAFQTVLTFLLITVAWVFFRADSIADALYIVPRMFVPTVWVFTDGTLMKQGLSAAELGIAMVSAVVVFGAEWLSLRKDLLEALVSQYLVYRWLVYYALVFAIVVFGAYGGSYKAADFVYFKY
jgi:alginate O-acetyltransferase complex protein AlgI